MSQQIHKPLLRFFVLEGSEEGRCLGSGAGALTDHDGSCVSVFEHQGCTIEKLVNVFWGRQWGRPATQPGSSAFLTVFNWAVCWNS